MAFYHTISRPYLSRGIGIPSSYSVSLSACLPFDPPFSLFFFYFLIVSLFLCHHSYSSVSAPCIFLHNSLHIPLSLALHFYSPLPCALGLTDLSAHSYHLRSLHFSHSLAPPLSLFSSLFSFTRDISALVTLNFPSKALSYCLVDEVEQCLSQRRGNDMTS